MLINPGQSPLSVVHAASVAEESRPARHRGLSFRPEGEIFSLVSGRIAWPGERTARRSGREAATRPSTEGFLPPAEMTEISK